MRTFQFIISLLISPCIFSQAIFDSTKVRSTILRAFVGFPKANKDTLIDFNSFSLTNSRQFRKNVRIPELIELTNHPKASVRVYALHTLIWRDQKYAWQLLQKNAADTNDWFLSPVEDGAIAKTFIDELLDNIITSPSNYNINEIQRDYIVALKIKRKQAQKNFMVHQYSNDPHEKK